MKAPEKIFLYPYSTDGIYEVETKPLEGTVEYTRTDAFMDKAVDWLRKSLDNGCWVANNLGEYEKKVVIEHFKEAMKL